MSKLVIVGAVAFDAIETPFGKTDKILGGPATFIGLAASQFEVDSAIVSIVGGDFPNEYLDMFKNRGIDISEQVKYVDLDNSDLFEEIRGGNNQGVFQFESYEHKRYFSY